MAPRAPGEKLGTRFQSAENLAIMEREARSERELQARRADQEREDRINPQPHL